MHLFKQSLKKISDYLNFKLGMLILFLSSSKGVSAQSDISISTIKSGGKQLETDAKDIGLVVAAVMIIFAGILISLGNKDGKEKVSGVFIGVFVMCAGGGLIMTFRSYFGA